MMTVGMLVCLVSCSFFVLFESILISFSGSKVDLVINDFIFFFEETV